MRRPNPVVLASLTLLLFKPGASAQSLDEFEERVTEGTLSNGIRVILVERHTAPIASFVCQVGVGSANEVPGITGLAHLLEHMAFRGNDVIGTTDLEAEARAMAREDELYHELQKARRQEDDERVAELESMFAEAQEEAGSYAVPDELGRIIDREGGRGFNAGTSNDNTTFVVSLPSNKVELWAYVESEHLLHGVLRGFYRERDVVTEERRHAQDQPWARLLEQFNATAFTGHPYGQPLLGYMSDLQSLTREDARRFLEKHYVPQNITLAIVGDIEPQETLGILETYFGRIERGPDPEPIRTVEARVPAERTVTLYEPGQPQYFVGYPIPSIRHDDYPVLTVLSAILAEGRTSRLYERMVTEQKIARSVGAWPGHPNSRYPNQLLIVAVAAAGHSNDEVATSIERELARIKAELVSVEELTRAKTGLRADLVRSLGTNLGLAEELAFYDLATGDWRNLFRFMERIEDLTAEDVRRVAKVYLDEHYRTVGRIETVSEGSSAGRSGRMR